MWWHLSSRGKPIPFYFCQIIRMNRLTFESLGDLIPLVPYRRCQNLFQASAAAAGMESIRAKSSLGRSCVTRSSTKIMYSICISNDILNYHSPAKPCFKFKNPPANIEPCLHRYSIQISIYIEKSYLPRYEGRCTFL